MRKKWPIIADSNPFYPVKDIRILFQQFHSVKTALTTIKGVIEVMVLVMGRCPSPNITAEINNG